MVQGRLLWVVEIYIASHNNSQQLCEYSETWFTGSRYWQDFSPEAQKRKEKKTRLNWGLFQLFRIPKWWVCIFICTIDLCVSAEGTLFSLVVNVAVNRILYPIIELVGKFMGFILYGAMLWCFVLSDSGTRVWFSCICPWYPIQVSQVDVNLWRVASNMVHIWELT